MLDFYSIAHPAEEWPGRSGEVEQKYELSRRKMLGTMAGAGAGLVAASGTAAADSAASAIPTSAPRENEMYDVGIIGLGSVGSFTAYNLAARGLNVLGLEAGPVAHDNCAVGGDTRLFRRLYKEGAHYHPLLERSLELWHEIAERVDHEVFRQNSVLNLVEDGSADDQALSRYARRFDVPHERLSGAEVVERFPQYAGKERMIGYLDPGGGYLRPDRLVLDAITRAYEAGLTRATGQVTEVTRNGDGYRIHCGDGQRFSCRRVVFSAGARTRRLLPERLRKFFTPNKLTMTWFSAVDPERFGPDKFPTFTYGIGDFSLYGVPTIDGDSVKVAGFNPSTPADFDGFDFDSRVSLAQRWQAADRIGQVFNGFEATPVRAKGYPDLYSKDGDFVVDFMDSDRSAVVAAGFSGAGFKMSSGLGEHVAQLITGDADPYPAFRLSRFG